MINTYFYINNPFSKQGYENIFSTGGKLFKNKYWEINIERSSSIFGLMLRIPLKQNCHAGIFFSIVLFGYGLDFEFYDVRHLDRDAWFVCPEQEEEVLK